MSSLFSLVLFAPLFMAFALFLAAEIAAVLGIVASVVHLCERGLAASNSEWRGGMRAVLSWPSCCCC